jgi:hypothetical protein
MNMKTGKVPIETSQWFSLLCRKVGSGKTILRLDPNSAKVPFRLDPDPHYWIVCGYRVPTESDKKMPVIKTYHLQSCPTRF